MHAAWPPLTSVLIGGHRLTCQKWLDEFIDARASRGNIP
jgi:hypothetical protein